MNDYLDKFQDDCCHLSKKDDELTNLNVQLTTHNATYDALVLDARLRQSLVTVRSLGRRGLHVAALEDCSGGCPAFSSRWCQQGFVCPSVQTTKAYVSYLEQLLERSGARVLITSSDDTIPLIRRYRERLEQRVRIALAKEPALGIAINKEQTLEVARRLGLGVPRGVSVKTVSEVRAALREIGLPAVVKPVLPWDERHNASMKCELVTTPDEARRAVEKLTRFGGATLFQQFLLGRREAVSFMYAHGQVYARFAQWAKRTIPPLGGTSVLRQSIAIPPDIGDQAERLVREIDLEGYSEVEFRRDGAGVPYLMEINPRLSASVEVATRAGVDFPYLLYQWANGDSIDSVKSYRVGVWMRFLEGDIITTVQMLTQHGRPGIPSPAQAALDFFVSFFTPSRYDYVDWRDPLPACIAVVEFGRYLVRRGRRGLSRRTSQ